MPTERERIENLLAQGKISTEEAERLKAALEKAERDESVRPAEETDSIDKPTLSPLALSGALGLPAALVVGLFVAGLAMVFTDSNDRVFGAAALVASAVVLAGVGLSVAGLVSIRRSDRRYRGRKLAHVGIWLPIGIALAATAVCFTLNYVRERAMQRESRAMAARSMREHHQGKVYEVWSRAFPALRQCRAVPPEERPATFLALMAPFLEPDWVAELADKGASDVSIEDTKQFRRIIEGEGPLGDVQERSLVAGVRMDEETLDGLDATLWVTCGEEKHVFSLKQIDGKWYFR